MNEKEDQSSTVRVTIYGQEYPIRGHQGDAEYIRRVARYVDERMAQIEEQTSIHSVTRLAILAALNITDELFVQQSDKERLLGEFEAKAREIAEQIDQGLKTP